MTINGMRILLSLFLLFPLISFCQEQKPLDRENKENIKQEAEAKLELFNKKIDSLKLRINKETSEEKIQLEQAMDNVEAKRKELKSKIESEDLNVNIEEWKSNIKKAWEELKEKLQEFEEMASKEQSRKG
jgi:type III secretory pathway component EscR